MAPMDRERRVDLENLMQRQGWLRALARSLVSDVNAADDLVQEIWVAALEHAPREGPSLRAWLRTVMRNLVRDRWRDGDSRAMRERDVARHEAVDEHSAERLDGAELVVRLVRELDEPYRTVVLLRYYDELAPREIAARLGVPVATVHTRLTRALERLRETLDRRAGGRTNWVACVVPLAQGAAVGGLVMKTQTKFGVAASILLLLAGASWWVAHSSSAPAESALAARELANPALETANAERTSADVGVPLPRVEAARTLTASAVTTPAPPEIFLRGRVVGDGRFPVAGATVDLVLDSDDRRSTKTRDDGSFEFAVAVGSREAKDARLLARLGDDRAGLATARLAGPDAPGASLYAAPHVSESEVDVGTIPLVAAVPVSVVVDEGGVPVAGARVAAHLYWRWPDIASVLTDERGVAHLGALPLGPMRLTATLGAASVARDGFFPEDASASLSLAPARTVEVHVVDASTGAPIAGAALEVVEDLNCSATRDRSMATTTGTIYIPHPEWSTETNASGTASVRIADVPRAFVTVRREGYVSAPNSYVDAPLWLRGERLEVRLRASTLRESRWPIVSGDVAIPADGTALDVRWEPGSSWTQELPQPSGVVRDGHVVVNHAESGAAFVASTSDGAIARLRGVPAGEIGEPVQFRRARKLDVFVRDGDGHLLARAAVQPRNHAYNRLCDWCITDANGHAQLTGLFGGIVDVFVAPPGANSSDSAACTVDLESGDGRVEVTLPNPVLFRVRTLIGGRPCLPSEFSVGAGSNSRVVSEAPERGEATVAMHGAPENGPIRVQLRAPGFVMASGELTLASGVVEPVVEFSLRRAATLTAHIAFRESEPLDVGLEVWNAETSSWPERTVFEQEFHRPNGPNGVFVFAGLAPGAYRVCDARSRLASRAIEVSDTLLDAHVDLDLTDVEWVRGTVEAPNGTNLGLVHVFVDGVDDAPRRATGMPGSESPNGPNIEADGSFEILVPSGRAVTVRPWHPWLVPEAEHGSVVVEGGREGVVLKLAAGDDVRLPVPQLAERGRTTYVRVAAYHGAPSGEPVKWIHAPIVDGVARFGGLERGMWTLWIDPLNDFEPLVLSDVTVRDGSTVLPPANFVVGSSVRMRLLVRPGEALPSVHMRVESRTEPKFARQSDPNDETGIVVSGLAAGEYSLNVYVPSQLASRGPKSVTVDGQSDVELTLDLR